jgi:hypothetical protein
MIYTCSKCNKIFKQKSHYDRHCNRKTPCKKITSNSKSCVKCLSKKYETKPFSWYHDNMPDIFNFIINELDPVVKSGERRIIIDAEVKTGKRFIAQGYAVYNSSISGEAYAQVFISSWIRRDDDGQRKEINSYFKGTHDDPRVFKINTEKSRYYCIKKLKELVLTHDKVIVHHDELDYGSGTEQHMAAVYEYCISQEKITLISYSATFEEAVVENSINNVSTINPIKLKFIPPTEYRGVKWYCDNNLVHEAVPFFEKIDDNIILSEQAKTILKETEDNILSDDPTRSCKKLIIVRVNTPFEQTKELIDNNFFPELCCKEDIRILPEFVHSRKELNTINVKWDDYEWWKKHMEISRGKGHFIEILFIDQSSTRSTDWFCHPWLSVYHDYHPPNSSVACSGQSNPRLVYYTNKMCNGVRVYHNEEFYPKLYGQKEVIEYMAGLRPLNNLNRPVSTRAKVYENINTFGHVIEINFNDEEIENIKDILNSNLNDTNRSVLDKLIRQKLLKLNSKDRQKFENTSLTRTLKGKRVYKNDSPKQGGIYSVALSKLRNMNSGPGGGIGTIGGDVYNNRGMYYWMDLALDELTFEAEKETIKISRGTVYITYGIPDPELNSDYINDDDEAEDDDINNETVSESNYVHRKTKKSMFTIGV